MFLVASRPAGVFLLLQDFQHRAVVLNLETRLPRGGVNKFPGGASLYAHNMKSFWNLPSQAFVILQPI